MRGLWASVRPGENTGRASCPRQTARGGKPISAAPAALRQQSSSTPALARYQPLLQLFDRR